MNEVGEQIEKLDRRALVVQTNIGESAQVDDLVKKTMVDSSRTMLDFNRPAAHSHP